MFSVQDIENLLYLALFQGNGNQGNAYSGLIGADTCSSCPGGYYNFHYIMQYTGSDADLNLLVNYTGWDYKDLSKSHVKRPFWLNKSMSSTMFLGNGKSCWFYRPPLSSSRRKDSISLRPFLSSQTSLAASV